MANMKYPHIFTPGKIGNITIPNRIVMAPMGVGHFGEFFEERLVEFYGARARGGVGLILTENNYVSSFEEDPYPRFMPVPRFDDKRKISRAAAIADRIKVYGGVPGIQLGAGQGRNAESVMKDHPPMSVSAIPTLEDPTVLCKEMTREDIAKKVAAFERAAKNAEFCGFQIIEVHAHTGYLLEQFLNKNLNHRTDEYGGSAENRFRFAKEILEGIRRSVGHRVGVSIRMSLDNKCADGITMEEGLEFCKLAEQAGYDAVHIDAGSRVSLEWTNPTPYVGITPLRYLAREAKKVVNIPVITVGGYLMPNLAEDALASGDADFVALGRPLMADPEWPKKAKLGREEDIRGCMQCNVMCAGHTFVNKTATCAVNPRCGIENQVKIEKTDEPKRVTIVGGGPAGMVAALVAQERGHQVKLLEKANDLGGNMNLICMEECKEGVRNYSRYLKRQIEKRNIDVQLNCEANMDAVKATAPDVVIAATGSFLYIPDIPGFKNNDRVITIKQMHEETEFCEKEKIVVVGGGVNGCEVALDFGKNGHDVVVVEMMKEFATSLPIINHMSLMTQLGKLANVRLFSETICKFIEGNTLVCKAADGEELRFEFDHCIVAVGMKSDNKFANELAAEFPETYIIGDAVSQEQIGGAVHQGFFTGLRI